MFATFPGFEEFALRVEVKWQGRARVVKARLETWPASSPFAVLVCHFEDAPDDGEWLVLYSDGRGPFPVTRPDSWTKTRRIVRDSFARHHSNVGRVVLFAEQEAPRLTLLLPPSRGEWLEGWGTGELSRIKTTPFVLSRSIEQATEAEAADILKRDWSDENSDARFAWNWALLSDEEKVALVCGFDGNWSEVKRLMRRILQQTSALWESGSAWSWTIHHEFGAHSWLVNLSNQTDRSQSARLNRWGEWLFAHFFATFQTQLIKNHSCVSQFWEHVISLAVVQLSEPPTMHERLEARLALREWLEGKAAPDEIERLLSP